MGGSCSLGIPSGKGPNNVGCTDLMVDHTIQGTFLRLYYPCETSASPEWPPWIPKKEYFNGLADFLKISRSLGDRMFSYLYGSYTVPAEWNAPFKPGNKYPLIIFSHGLGAFRSLYSAVCIEIASQGFIVAAVEHRDESASATFYYKDQSTEQQHQVSSTPEHLKEEWLYYRTLKPGEPEFPLRNQQVQQRANECIGALNLLTDINAGQSVNNVLNLHFDWSKLKDSMDLCRTAIMGHSFGGATVIQSLCRETKFKCGVALDSWMFPLDDEVYARVTQPILFINSEKFQWLANIMKMKMLDANTIQRKMITIKGTVHQSFPDFTFLTGHLIGKIFKLKGEIDPNIAIDLCNKASLAFLQRHLEIHKNFNQWDPLIDGMDANLIPGTNIHLPSANTE
ncbi:platelet-activating factor acetylhydrolase [Acipenser oxyrinchus oxyrinchus]|uniref:Platelet-activating factor acetylhydrolase n=1 Tax=Acipenser oxyrinchus oxyrinchus TaxID=40147 RepID=A0AAD8GCS2_ACIOX|nr:platelet-activating factor acetylhydrolase [Acipenser oxyrinchus oxyrinchus]